MWTIISTASVVIVGAITVLAVVAIALLAASAHLERAIRALPDATPLGVLAYARAHIEVFYRGPTPARFVRARRAIRRAHTYLQLAKR